jgi:hypothetical protein
MGHVLYGTNQHQFRDFQIPFVKRHFGTSGKGWSFGRTHEIAIVAGKNGSRAMSRRAQNENF